MSKTITNVIAAMSRNSLRDKVTALSDSLPRAEFIATLTPDYIATAGSIGKEHSPDIIQNDLGELYDNLHNPRYRTAGNGIAGRS